MPSFNLKMPLSIIPATCYPFLTKSQAKNRPFHFHKIFHSVFLKVNHVGGYAKEVSETSAITAVNGAQRDSGLIARHCSVSPYTLVTMTANSLDFGSYGVPATSE